MKKYYISFIFIFSIFSFSFNSINNNNNGIGNFITNLSKKINLFLDKKFSNNKFSNNNNIIIVRNSVR